MGPGFRRGDGASGALRDQLFAASLVAATALPGVVTSLGTETGGVSATCLPRYDGSSTPATLCSTSIIGGSERAMLWMKFAVLPLPTPFATPLPPSQTTTLSILMPLI